MVGSLPGCCECAASGHTAAVPPSSVMNSSPRRRRQAGLVGRSDRASCRPIAFDELHIGLLDHLAVDGRLDVFAPRVVDVHLVVDGLRGGGGLLLRHRNGLQRGRLEGASRKDRAKCDQSL